VNILTAIFSSYVICLVITKSHLFLPARKLFRRIMWRTPLRHTFVRYIWTACCDPAWGGESKDGDAGVHKITQHELLIEDDEAPDEITGGVVRGFCFISCRLCVGFYVSMVVAWLLHVPVEQWFMVYGASYAIATQERS